MAFFGNLLAGANVSKDFYNMSSEGYNLLKDNDGSFGSIFGGAASLFGGAAGFATMGLSVIGDLVGASNKADAATSSIRFAQGQIGTLEDMKIDVEKASELGMQYAREGSGMNQNVIRSQADASSENIYDNFNNMVSQSGLAFSGGINSKKNDLLNNLNTGYGQQSEQIRMGLRSDIDKITEGKVSKMRDINNRIAELREQIEVYKTQDTFLEALFT